jgi:superfamily II DNA/RNA helicase
MWSILLSPKIKNTIGIAPTGSGKTLSYALPTFLTKTNRLVLVPTRELVQQVSEVYQKLIRASPKCKLKVVSVYGGVDKQIQINALKQASLGSGRLILVATPGRLLDLLKNHEESLTFKTLFGWIVLDEADQLSKDGDLGPQVNQILSFLKHKEESKLVLVSATYPERCQAKFQEWISIEHVLVQVDSLSSQDKNNNYATIPPHLEQVLHVCSDHKKPKKLINTLSAIKKKYVNERNAPLGICFFARIDKVKYVAKLLEKEGIVTAEIHSQLSNVQRTANLNLFKCGKRPLLLATDVAARGMDISHVKFVIQYDFPSNLEQYIHRCGRAGRTSGDTATIYSFFTRNLKPLAKDMVDLLERTHAWVDPNLRVLMNKSNNRDKGKKTKSPRKQEQPKRKAPPPQQKRTTIDSHDDDDDDEFPELLPNRIVLKRASHVSDASSSEDEDE